MTNWNKAKLIILKNNYPYN